MIAASTTRMIPTRPGVPSGCEVYAAGMPMMKRIVEMMRMALKRGVSGPTSQTSVVIPLRIKAYACRVRMLIVSHSLRPAGG